MFRFYPLGCQRSIYEGHWLILKRVGLARKPSLWVDLGDLPFPEPAHLLPSAFCLDSHYVTCIPLSLMYVQALWPRTIEITRAVLSSKKVGYLVASEL